MDARLVGGQGRLSGENSPGQHGRHVHAAQLGVEVAARGRDRALDRVVGMDGPEPEHALCGEVLLGEAHTAEQQRKQGEANVASAGAEGSRHRLQPARLPPGDRQLLEGVPDLVGQRREVARRGPVWEVIVGPQVAQDLDQVGLAAAVEAADPDRRLLRVAHVAQVGVEDLLEAAGVLALAHEGTQLVAQRLHIVGWSEIGDRRDTIVRDRRLQWVLGEHIAVERHGISHPSGL